MISSHYEYNRAHFHFVRQHSGEAPERSAPISGWGPRFSQVAVLGISFLLLGPFTAAALFRMRRAYREENYGECALWSAGVVAMLGFTVWWWTRH